MLKLEVPAGGQHQDQRGDLWMQWNQSRNWLVAEGNAEKPSIKKTDLTSVIQSSPYWRKPSKWITVSEAECYLCCCLFIVLCHIFVVFDLTIQNNQIFFSFFAFSSQRKEEKKNPKSLHVWAGAVSRWQQLTISLSSLWLTHLCATLACTQWSQHEGSCIDLMS